MPETQTQEATTSTSGANIRAKLKPVSHFPIAIGEAAPNYSQLSEESFGVKTDQNKYQTTSVFSSLGTDRHVYAICRGQVFLQPTTGANDKVNLILRPFTQPIQGISIKYFVYRGLNKSSFFNSATGKIAGSHNSGSEFCQYIWREFNAFYGEEDAEQTETQFLAEFIGYPSQNNEQPLTSLIDDYFFKISKTYEGEELEEGENSHDFEFPMVRRGMQLGKVSGTMGLDIVLSDGDFYTENDPNPFKLDLNFARASVHILDVNNGTTAYQKKLIREASTRFVDPSAYFGLHANGFGKLFINDTTEALTTREQISTLLEPLQTSTKTYLYIQSNRQRSYNFYGNYKHPNNENVNIKIGITEGSLTEKTFGTNGWPVHVVDNASEIYVQLITDNHNQAVLYNHTGVMVSDQEDGYVRNENLLQTPSQDQNNVIDTNYTKAIHFITKKEEGDPTESYIEPFIQLIYEGKRLVIPGENTPTDETPRVYYLKDIDDIFGLLNAGPFLKVKNKDEMCYVTEHLTSIINFPNTKRGDDIGLVKTRRIEDKIKITEEENLARITYETLLHGIRSSMNTYTKSNNATPDSNAKSGSTTFSAQQNNFYQPQSPYYLKTQVFTAGSQTVTGVRLETVDGSLPTKKILGLTKAENERIRSKTLALHNPKIYLKNKLYNKDDVYTSPENIKYREYEVLIIAENNEGELQLYQPNNAEQATEYTPIIVFAIDGNVFASHEYGKHIPEFIGFKISTIYKI